MTAELPTRGMSTRQLAEALGGLSAEGIRVRLCRTGSYHGLRPRKLPGGRLLWPEDSVERLLETAENGGEAA